MTNVRLARSLIDTRYVRGAAWRMSVSRRGDPANGLPSQLDRPPEHVVDHGRRQSTRERVLLARMEAAQQRVATDDRLRAVAEDRSPSQRARPAPPAPAAAPSQPQAPKQTMVRTVGRSSSSRRRKGRQRSRSSGVGLLAGGAHRLTAAMIDAGQPLAVPAHRWTSAGWRVPPDGAPRTGSRPNDRR